MLVKSKNGSITRYTSTTGVTPLERIPQYGSRRDPDIHVSVGYQKITNPKTFTQEQSHNRLTEAERHPDKDYGVDSIRYGG